MIESDVLLVQIGKPVEEPALRALLNELGVPAKGPRLENRFGEHTAKDAGIVLFFRTAAQPDGRVLPVLTDVQFSAKGFGGGPPYTGQLPFGISFADTRAATHERLGPPASTAQLAVNDRWTLGERYLTIDFLRDGSAIKKVTFGVR
jgi:hypothetical protein